MFFTSQSNREINDVLGAKKTVGPIREYNRLLESLTESVSLYIFTSAPPDWDAEPRSVLSFNNLVSWAKEDWKEIFKQLEENWLIIWIARGGMILLDEIENNVDDFIWSFIKPKVNVRSHEGEDVFEAFTDEHLVTKLKEFSNEEPLNVLFIEDIVEEDEYESNVVTALEYLADKLIDLDIELGTTACLALLTRTSQISSIPVYGVLISYSGGIETEWGNDNPEGLDYHDFSEVKEYVEDHDT
ncbi:MAG: hypothetical protein ACXAC7_15585 [Candidatus Hodarchaeales archaeon]|jgi:hypothetical protein